MGYTYNELIAPATLFNNPGITREEFTDQLDNTHSSTLTEYSAKDPWDIFDKDDSSEWLYYHRGLWSLAVILRLSYTEAYQQFQQPTIDGNGLQLDSPTFHQLSRGEQERSRAEFTVVSHAKNIIGPSKVVKELSWNKLQAGDIWRCVMGSEKGLVTRIDKETILRKKGKAKDRDEYDEKEDDVPRYTYKMEIRPFYQDYRREKFNNKEDLFSIWPQFNPDFMYDFTQERGNFGIMLGNQKFRWFQRDGRYYLDEQTFDQIPASGRVLNYGYTDLVLTASALKERAWKLLSYRGLKHMSAFFRDFPQARQVYERAVWDSHISLYAKGKAMTYSDFLRFRLCPIQDSHEEINKLFFS